MKEMKNHTFSFPCLKMPRRAFLEVANRASVAIAVACFFLVTSYIGINATEQSADASTGKDAFPNIVLILADDMGYGDMQSYNPQSKIPTPHLERLVSAGMRFTDAHSPSAVCTPTRYGLLTGRYAWRTKLKRGVLWGYSPLLIEDDRVTLASFLKARGYHTAAIGKWHLGMGAEEANYFPAPIVDGRDTSFDFGYLRPGPNEVGFDYFFGIPASLDMKPYIYVENARPYTPLTGRLVEASKMRRHGGGGYWRKGQIAEGFVHEDVLPQLTAKAVSYIQQRGQNGNGQPFFLYFPLAAPHTPWLPVKEFQGKSGAGYYGDFVAQVDDTVGQIMAALAQQGFADNTLVIFTSDNGAHWLSTDIEQFDHLANGLWRGQKADIYEGGHRVPFIAKWTGHIPAGTVSDLPIVHTDLMATVADIVNAAPDYDAGSDSFSLLPALRGEPVTQDSRPPLVHHSLHGMFAIREGHWKLIEGLGSGGFTEPAQVEAVAGEDAVRLYNLATDPAETNNVASEHPQVVVRLRQRLAQIKQQL